MISEILRWLFIALLAIAGLGCTVISVLGCYLLYAIWRKDA